MLPVFDVLLFSTTISQIIKYQNVRKSHFAARYCSCCFVLRSPLGRNIEMLQNLRGLEADLSKEGARITLVIALSAKS